MYKFWEAKLFLSDLKQKAVLLATNTKYKFMVQKDFLCGETTFKQRTVQNVCHVRIGDNWTIRVDEGNKFPKLYRLGQEYNPG